MPYTIPLDDPPGFPNVSAKVTNPDNTLAREFVTFLNDLREWIVTVQAALGETGTTVTTVGGLPTASTHPGVRYTVTDASAATFMSVVAAGGANIVPVFSDGTAWRIG